MKELVWVRGRWYHPHCPGVTKADILNSQYNLATLQGMAAIDDEHDPDFKLAVMQFLEGWHGAKGYHILFWKSRFAPQHIEGRRLSLMLPRLCPVSCHYKHLYKFDPDVLYVVSSTEKYDLDTVQQFTMVV